jgi:hypothetical protein
MPTPLSDLKAEATPGLCLVCDTKLPPQPNAGRGMRYIMCPEGVKPECRREYQRLHKQEAKGGQLPQAYPQHLRGAGQVVGSP